MINCPNDKCGSQMPNTFRYCIYCSAKLPQTPENKAAKEKAPFTPYQIGIVIASVLTIALMIIAAVTVL